MAHVVKDRVKETTTTTGTGTLTLAGAVAQFQSFSGIGNGNTTFYTLVDANGTGWEVGIGTYTSAGTTLARTTILESSNANAAITLSAGTHTVFCGLPADKAVYLNTSSVIPTNMMGSGTAAANTFLNGTNAYSVPFADPVTFMARFY